LLLASRLYNNPRICVVVSGGQPEYANEDLEEELTEIRPLDIPLDILELKTFELKHHPYATSTMRTFENLDFEELTTIRSRITELPQRQKTEGNIRHNDEDADSYGGDSSNPSLPGVTTTEYYSENRPDVEREENNEIIDDDEYDDDYIDDDGYSHEDGGGGDADDDDDDSDDDDEDDNDDDGDGDGDDTKTKNPKINYEGKRRMYGKRSKHVTSAGTFQTLKKSTNFEDSVEHGRQTKEEDSKDFSTSGTRKGGEGSTLTVSGTPGRDRSALERDLATLLKNESPEAEDEETRNVTKRIRKENDARNTKKNTDSGEANSYAIRNLQQIRELEKKANIPHKVKYFHFTVIFMHSVILIGFISRCTLRTKSSLVYCLSRCVLHKPRHVSVFFF
jgi:hypothetical protein